MIDVAERKLVRVLPAGTDPEQFAVTADGAKIYDSNEDAGTASVVGTDAGRC